MKVSGFTIVRNAVKYDYPVVESITSILPVVDEMIVAVGKSEDETLHLIQGIASSKIKIIETVWNDSLRSGGKLLADETDKAKRAVSADADWCFYIQADEVLHEEYLEPVRQAMLFYRDDKEVDGLLFNYEHFYGSYDYVADSYNWYRKEIRIIRNRPDIFSYKDAQGFRKTGNRKLNVKQVDATVFHYGWVKDPQAQQRKQKTFHQMWHPDEWIEKNVAETESFDYSLIDSLKKFEGTHPQVMKDRIKNRNWAFEFDTSKSNRKFKYRIRKWIEDLTGINIGEYKNYKRI